MPRQQTQSHPCPLCDSLSSRKDEDAFKNFDCPNCGHYEIDALSLVAILTYRNNDPASRILLRHALSKMHRRETCPRLTFPIVEHVIQATTLPDLKEQLDNLILWVARTSKGFGVPIIRAVFDKALGPVGAANPTGLDFIFQRAEKTNLIEVERTQLHGGFLYQNIVLTFEGWNHYEEVQRAATNSRLAFMAMKFGNTQTERIYREFFKPAVAQTGFELRRNDEEQRAGLIDDLMRVQIRQSRFVLSDLTDHNNGAYWEAGYAEGLGKPVIYTCREDHFDDPSMGAHFDTNHHLTVLWNPDNMAPAVEKLKATIRATLPEDASLEDVLTPLG